MDPIILSYCIYGYVTSTIAKLRYEGADNLAKEIANRSRDVLRDPSASQVDIRQIDPWLEPLSISGRDFNQYSRLLNPDLTATWFTTIALLGQHIQKAEYIRQGFISEIDGFTSVTFLLTIY